MHLIFLCTPPGVCWSSLERILVGMRSDWPLQRFFSDWLFISRFPLWGLLWITVSLSPLLYSSLRFLLLLRLCVLWTAAGCSFDVSVFDWLKQNQQCGCSAFLSSQRCSMWRWLPTVTLGAKWAVKNVFLSKLSAVDLQKLKWMRLENADCAFGDIGARRA